MSTPQILKVHRRDCDDRTLITLTGEVDLASVDVVRESLTDCLRDGIRVIDVDLASVGFCDCTGLDAFLEASSRAADAGGSLRLYNPNPVVARLLVLTDTGFLLRGSPNGRVRRDRPADAAVPVRQAFERAPCPAVGSGTP